MTAKEFVREHMPSAIAERHVEGHIVGLKKVYYLIRERRKTMYVSTGE